MVRDELQTCRDHLDYYVAFAIILDRTPKDHWSHVLQDGPFSRMVLDLMIRLKMQDLRRRNYELFSNKFELATMPVKAVEKQPTTWTSKVMNFLRKQLDLFKNMVKYKKSQ